MDIPREQREVLKALSTEIFGKSSRYQKLYEGQELITKMVSVEVPATENEPATTKDVEVAATLNGVKQYRMKYRSTEEVYNLLLEFKTKRDEHLAKLKQEQDLEKAKLEGEQLAKKIQEDLGGSAL